MEHNNNHNQNNGNGFLLGVIVGVLLTLLFTTKRGRAIFKEVMEKGVKKFSNLEDLLRESDEIDLEEDSEEDNDFIAAEPVTVSEPLTEVKEPEKKLDEEKVEPQPIKEKETLSSIKPVKETHVPEKSTPEKKGEQEEKPKAAHGKRWFRGLRKKN